MSESDVAMRRMQSSAAQRPFLAALAGGRAGSGGPLGSKGLQDAFAEVFAGMRTGSARSSEALPEPSEPADGQAEDKDRRRDRGDEADSETTTPQQLHMLSASEQHQQNKAADVTTVRNSEKSAPQEAATLTAQKPQDHRPQRMSGADNDDALAKPATKAERPVPEAAAASAEQVEVAPLRSRADEPAVTELSEQKIIPKDQLPKTQTPKTSPVVDNTARQDERPAFDRKPSAKPDAEPLKVEEAIEPAETTEPAMNRRSERLQQARDPHADPASQSPAAQKQSAESRSPELTEAAAQSTNRPLPEAGQAAAPATTTVQNVPASQTASVAPVAAAATVSAATQAAGADQSSAANRSQTARVEAVSNAFGLSEPGPKQQPVSSGAGQGRADKNGTADTVSRVKLIQRVSRAFHQLGSNGGVVRLRLAPAELGTVRIEMRVHNKQLDARVIAESEAATQTLREHLPELRMRLESQGMNIEKIDIRSESGDVTDDPRNQGSPSGFGDRESEQDSSSRRGPTLPRHAATPTSSRPQQEPVAPLTDASVVSAGVDVRW